MQIDTIKLFDKGSPILRSWYLLSLNFQVFHKQFNSPIGLYSNNNIEDTIRSTVP